MDQNQSHNPASIPQSSAEFGSFPNDAESIRKLPNGSESFRTFRNPSEGFRNLPNGSERKENHTLSVRESARMFEAAGVARTERSIINWCQVNKMGVARLDSYFDPNERKYFITPQSVESAIAEEKAKAEKLNSESSETLNDFPKASEARRTEIPPAGGNGEQQESRGLHAEIMDLKITNKAKDMWIEQLKDERKGILDQLITTTRKVGELETKLLQLQAPENTRPAVSEGQFRTAE